MLASPPIAALPRKIVLCCCILYIIKLVRIGLEGRRARHRLRAAAAVAASASAAARRGRRRRTTTLPHISTTCQSCLVTAVKSVGSSGGRGSRVGGLPPTLFHSCQPSTLPFTAAPHVRSLLLLSLSLSLQLKLLIHHVISVLAPSDSILSAIELYVTALSGAM